MRDAALALAPPLSGWASRNRRRKRRFTSSRSTSIPARKPSTSIAQRWSGPTPLHNSSSGGPPEPPPARRRERWAVPDPGRLRNDAQLDVGRETAPTPVQHPADPVE